MNKKYFFPLLIGLLTIINLKADANTITPVPAETSLKETVRVEAENNDIQKPKEKSIIEKISLKNKFQKTPESQIEDFVKKYNRYSQKNEIEKLKELYDENYVNNDGFDKNTVFKLMQMAQNAYDEVDYETVIEKIEVNGNYATVTAKETANGITTKTINSIEDKGSIYSEVYYTNYLKKEGNKWKILSTEVKSEIVILKYGEAKNMEFQITAPDYISSDAEYEITARTEAPPESFIVGSIINEPIVFPVTQNNDVYRAVKSDEIARVVKSNSDNNNEYATVTLAVTRAMLEPPTVVINMTGMAFIMKRVNVIKKKELKLEEVTVDGKSEG